MTCERNCPSYNSVIDLFPDHEFNPICMVCINGPPIDSHSVEYKWIPSEDEIPVGWKPACNKHPSGAYGRALIYKESARE